MTAYEILGVDSKASIGDIKLAYRRLVKQYHPDRNNSAEAKEKILLINEAYDLLSDPVKRAQYDAPSYATEEQIVYEEDPREAYRREYLRTRGERERKKREAVIEREKLMIKRFRWFSFPIFAFVVLLISDRFLPEYVVEEVAEEGWQEVRRGKHTTSIISRMRTAHFTFRVPHVIHIDYPYYDDPKPVMRLHVTPLFDVVKFVEVAENGRFLSFATYGDISGYYIPMTWILFVSCIYTMIRKDYSLLTFCLCFLPVILLVMILIALI